jgi:hypothetical protein
MTIPDDRRKAAEEYSVPAEARLEENSYSYTSCTMKEYAIDALHGAHFDGHLHGEKRVIEMLRSDTAMGAELDLGLRSGDFELVASWLEKQMK